MTTAREIYDAAYAEAQDEIYNTHLGFAEFMDDFLGSDRPLQELAFRTTLQKVLNDKPGAVDALKDLFYEAVETYAQHKADKAIFPRRPLTKLPVAPFQERMGEFVAGLTKDFGASPLTSETEPESLSVDAEEPK